MFGMERANTGTPVRWISLVGVLLVPIIVASGFLAALWKADTRMHHVQAAVVNHDEMVEVNGQKVPLGRQLSAGLVERRDDNFDWVLADEDHATEGLKTGEYAAVVTIPEDFSAKATSFGGPAADAEQARIDVQTSKVAGVTDGAIAEVITETARTTLNTELTKQYLDGIYLGFNSMGEQFQTVADAAGELADGANGLSRGIGQTHEGADELADGMTQYADGVGDAASGAHDLSDGLDELGRAGGQLKSGGSELAGGASKLAGGAQQLSGGTSELAHQTRDLPGQTAKLARGVGAAADGAGELADGLGEAKQQMPQLTDGTQQLADGANQLAPGVKQYVGGVNQLVDGLQPVTDALGELSEEDISNLQQAMLVLAESQENAALFAEQLAEFTQAECPTIDGATPEQQEQFCLQWELAQAGLTQPIDDTGLTPVEWADQIANSSELAEAAKTAEKLAPQLPTLVEQSQQLGQLKTGGAKLVTGSQQLADGATRLNDNVGQLADGVTAAADGSASLASGLDQAADGTKKLADGMGPLHDGIVQIDQGTRGLSDGAGQLASGIGQYTGGVAKYTDGVAAAADGTAQFATGMDQLATGADGLADGTTQLADGIGQLDDGGKQLADGATQLSDGLDEGADKVPHYSQHERTTLAAAAAEPVAGADASGKGIIPLGAATALLMVLALWLGGLATCLVIRAVALKTLISTRPTWQLVLHAFAPGFGIGVAQAVALTVIGQIVLDLSAGTVLAVFGLLILGAAVFTSINHALTAWLGGAGRIISVAMVTLTAAASIMSATPTFFHSLAPFSPLKPILDALKIVISGGSGLTGAVGMALAWLIVGSAASIASVVRHRQATPDDLRQLVLVS